MTMIPDAAKKVPMMFRAQVDGRCQLQRIPRDKTIEPDAVRWTSEWVEKSEQTVPDFGVGVENRTYKMTWRFVTNGGQDDGIIRPVIGAFGIPFYPGSSMKGAFRQACEQAERAGEIPLGKTVFYCGDERNQIPGTLRFHGGYPTSADWTRYLVDVIHPQQEWQVKTHNTQGKAGGAFVQISLYQPEFRFGISTVENVQAEDWKTIWQVWERALSSGLGCRVCAGYGQPEAHTGNILCRMTLQGQGPVSKLLDRDRTPEFRPNMFRAGLRGHALRIFGGLTDEYQAETLVDRLFGGISRDRGTQVGLIGMAFRELKPAVITDETYDVTGELRWLLTQPIAADEEAILKRLVIQLMQFAMVLGGFGKSWRRADHQLFLPNYEDHLIGCHWTWTGKRSPVWDNPVRNLQQVAPFIDQVIETAKIWSQSQNITLDSNQVADWREAWCKDRAQVWGRVADNQDESIAIDWLHKEYGIDYQGRTKIPLKIKDSTITGKLNQIGRLWHRMYPVILRQPDPSDPRRAIPKPTPRYLELLTLFPDGTEASDRFLQFLSSEQEDFQKLW